MRRTQSKGQGGAEEANIYIREKSNKLKTKTKQTWGTCSRVDGREGKAKGPSQGPARAKKKGPSTEAITGLLGRRGKGRPGFGGRSGETGEDRCRETPTPISFPQIRHRCRLQSSCSFGVPEIEDTGLPHEGFPADPSTSRGIDRDW